MKKGNSNDKWLIAWGQYMTVIVFAILFGAIVDYYFPSHNRWIGAIAFVFISALGISAATRMTGLSIPYLFPIRTGKNEIKGYYIVKKGFKGFWKNVLLALILSLLVYIIEMYWLR